MFYVMSEMLIYLLIALGLGFFLGWLERGKKGLGELDAQVRSHAQNSRNEHSAFNNKIATLEAKLDRTEKDLNGSRKTGKERDKLRADLIKAQTETEAVRGEVDAAESRAGTLQNELEVGQKAHDQTLAELNESKAVAGDLEAKLERCETNIKDLQSTATKGVKTAKTQEPDDLDTLEEDLEAAQIELAAARESMEQALDDEDNGIEIEIEVEDSPVSSPVDDDLKTIKGIGPVLERKLKAMRLTSYEQLANLSKEDSERINTELNFKDRHIRDDWKGKAAKAHKAKYG